MSNPVKGVYILIQKGPPQVAVYVGKSRQMKTRLLRHSDISYDYVIKIPIEYSKDRSRIERQLVKLLHPEHNKIRPK